jgi:uncharacterized membrane protein YvbJ
LNSFCTKCGGGLGEGDAFCKECGTAVSPSLAASPTPAPPVPPAAARKKRTWLTVVIAVASLVIVAVVVVIVVFLVRNTPAGRIRLVYQAAGEKQASQNTMQIDRTKIVERLKESGITDARVTVSGQRLTVEIPRVDQPADWPAEELD